MKMFKTLALGLLTGTAVNSTALAQKTPTTQQNVLEVFSDPANNKVLSFTYKFNTQKHPDLSGHENVKYDEITFSTRHQELDVSRGILSNTSIHNIDTGMFLRDKNPELEKALFTIMEEAIEVAKDPNTTIEITPSGENSSIAYKFKESMPGSKSDQAAKVINRLLTRKVQ